MRFLAELQRRNVFRMASLYLVGAWLVVQVAATLLPVFDAPPWVMKVLVIVLTIGFVVAVVFSWIYELTPAGLKRDEEVTDSDGSYRGPERRQPRLQRIDNAAPGLASRPDARRLNRSIIALLLLAIGYFVIDKYLIAPPAAPFAAASATATSARSGLVAVLPFRNRSTLPEDSYFAEGLHDDLLTKLSKIEGLKVISRTSMMRYADTRLTIPEIARELGATVVLEGAVQRAGEQVLITVQLIDAQHDVHLWAERYDRSFSTASVFAIQVEIAAAVAEATQVVLSPADTRSLAAGSTSELAAYEAFLQGKLMAALDRATPERFAAAIGHFDRAIKIDPKFAHAYARRARVQWASYWFAYADAAMRDAARLSTQRAVELAPDDIETWMAQAYQHYWGELDYARAEAMLARVIERVPDYAEAWYARALVARRDGRFQDSIDAFEQALASDPANTDTLLELSNTLLTLGEFEESDAVRERVRALGGDLPSHTAEDLFNRGKIEAAWAAIDGPNDFYSTLPFRIALASRKPEWIAQALSTELWPVRLRQFPNYPEAYALAEAEALLVAGDAAAARTKLLAIKARNEARPEPYPGGWDSTSAYFYYPCNLPGMLGDLAGVRAAERDWLQRARRDAWAEGNVRQALAIAYARAGDPDTALDHLEAIHAQVGSVSFIGFSLERGLDSLRREPRYLALAEAHRVWMERQR